MTSSQPPLPVVRSLPPGFSIHEAFSRLSAFPGCLWLDSASQGPPDSDAKEIGRYSFLTADPIDELVASVQDDDPWPTLDAWCRHLPGDADPSLPPFQGGIAGLIGYEAATWLEPIGLARQNDLPTPALSLGLYDWTIATDHATNKSWIISQGLLKQGTDANPRDRYQVACRRADLAEAMLRGDVRPQGNTGQLKSEPTALAAGTIAAADQYPTPHDDLRSNFSGQQYRDSVSKIVRLIRDGDSFQVNLAQRLLKKAHLTSPDLYLRLRAANPAPFAAYYSGTDFDVLSSSPEGFLKVRGLEVETRPIKGTVRRTGDRARGRASRRATFRQRKRPRRERDDCRLDAQRSVTRLHRRQRHGPPVMQDRTLPVRCSIWYRSCRVSCARARRWPICCELAFQEAASRVRRRSRPCGRLPLWNRIRVVPIAGRSVTSAAEATRTLTS